MHKLNIVIEKHCKNCGKRLVLKVNRDVERKKFCSHKCCSLYTTIERIKARPELLEIFIRAGNTSNANKKKGLKGEKHPMWIKDRTKIKAKRFYTEEVDFTKEVLKERHYTCEITGTIGGPLSLHHKNGWKNFPEQRFDKKNVILIKRDIHKLFHKLYGVDVSENDWNKFVLNKEYNASIQRKTTKIF